MNNLYDDYKDNKANDSNNNLKNSYIKDDISMQNDKNINNKDDNKNILLSIGLILLIGLVISGFVIYNKQTSKKENNNKIEEKNKPAQDTNNTKPEEQLKIVNVNDKRRPYGVMINNHHAAWPQSGLDKAYLIYEIMVEGGITRMFALYTQDQNVEKIGSCRSARHNYIDYAQENDAVLVHFGASYIADEQFPVFKQDHIDGNYADSSYFYRDRNLGRAYEHTAFTTSDNIKNAIQNHGFRNERNKDYLLNYVSKEVNLSGIDGNIVANNISIKYSYYQTSTYEYDSVNKYYNRAMNGVNHTDLVTGQQYHFKNIIVYAVQYVDASSYGHQDLKNVGTGDGYYITNGYAVPITWEKKSRTEATIYKYKNGQEIEVNDGNTFIQIYPLGGNLSIS